MNRFLFAVSACALVFAAPVMAQEEGDTQQNAAAGPARTTGSMASRADISRHDAAKAAGFRALHLCTGLFTSEMSEDLVRATLSRSTKLPGFEETIDQDGKYVAVSYLDDMPPRYAVFRPNMGCTQLPIGADLTIADNLTPWPADLETPNLDDQPWPMGDVDAAAEIDADSKAALEAVLDVAFEDQAGKYKGDTWGVAIVKDGKIIAERYAEDEGYGPHVSARTNSMCKSLSASVVGVGVRKGLVDINEPAPLAAWRTPGDPRGKITINDMLHMASGLWTSGAGNPQRDIYGSGAPVSEISVLNMIDAEPGTQFVYSGSDTIMSVRAVREAFDDDAAWVSFPHRELMWKIGMTRTVMETDWRNDFLGSGQCWSTVRDFGRLGLLYLNDGKWNGEQILPADWSEYVSTYAPAQPGSHTTGSAGYGAQFWLYDERQGLQSPGYSAAGAYGQYAMIVPGENLVVVRRGLDVGAGFNIASFTADVIDALEK
ncbi:serine hydrolase domain-containing protein [Henriciella litoralis]|uniref:serine hydrolase domain-containing protein n=1 Tax=Henriciella litoralis TaxID=568102 RepID=UPI000A0747C7|nr:serine hydrolase [Henriciella litoralis]